MKPLAIDLCCGRGGWTRAFLEAGYRVVGFDVVRYPDYPGELVLQDVRTISGRQLAGALVIVASPPCEHFSRLDQPWTRKRNPPPPDLSIALAVKRIRDESGVPTVIECVRGALPYLNPIFGRPRRHGSFWLWGDYPALTPQILHRQKQSMGNDASKRAIVPYELARWIADTYARRTAA